MPSKKILLTGGGTGGHVFPLLAVADEIQKTRYTDIKLFYLGPKSPLNQGFLDRDIPVYNLIPSKLRRYFSFANFIDIPKFLWSIFQALFRLYLLMPDLVFSKGGPGALAVVLAAHFYMIPIVIHESDAVPGLTNKLSAKFAKRIGVAFESAAAYFNPRKVFFSGNPIRADLLGGEDSIPAAKSTLGFKKDLPLIFVSGGSQGSTRINRFVFDNLEFLLKHYQIFQQVGEGNLKESESLTEAFFKRLPPELRESYKFAGFLDANDFKMALSAADVVIARAGSGSIFEIAALGKPSILVPLEESANDHQRLNAYEYAKTGAAIVIEEANLKPNVVSTQIDDILEDKSKAAKMSAAAKSFAKPEASKIIAEEVLSLIGLSRG